MTEGENGEPPVSLPAPIIRQRQPGSTHEPFNFLLEMFNLNLNIRALSQGAPTLHTRSNLFNTTALHSSKLKYQWCPREDRGPQSKYQTRSRMADRLSLNLGGMFGRIHIEMYSTTMDATLMWWMWCCTLVNRRVCQFLGDMWYRGESEVKCHYVCNSFSNSSKRIDTGVGWGGGYMKARNCQPRRKYYYLRMGRDFLLYSWKLYVKNWVGEEPCTLGTFFVYCNFKFITSSTSVRSGHFEIYGVVVWMQMASIGS